MDRFKLDRKQLVPHGLRAGALAQFDQFDDATRMSQGHWLSLEGMRAYLRPNLRHADKVTAALHDTSLAPLEHTLFMYGDSSASKE